MMIDNELDCLLCDRKNLQSPTLKKVSGRKSEMVFTLRWNLEWSKVENTFQNNRDK